MATTARGIWSMDGSTLMDVVAVSDAVASSVQTALDNMAIGETGNGPRFLTTTARDNAFAAWVAAGGVMANGMSCVVAGVPQIYWGGAWANNLQSTIAFSSIPTGNVDTTTGTPWVDWYSMGNITIPAWATLAIVQWSIIRAVSLTAGVNTHVRLAIGAGDLGAEFRITEPAAAQSFHLTKTDSVSLTSTGTKAIKLQASRVGGGATSYRMDVSSVVSGTVTFKP